ncbi:phosphoserine phosphatase SerB [Pseudorhodoplanes sp.]|uniref:phosphoserine phosphatase SerB n=1 Tax=Pseudorhodoplanes sp. TaxID=1934341 RepID=UPI00391A8B51
MTHVATLIAAPGARLDDGLVAQARALLPAAAPAEWLDPGVAADIAFSLDAATDQRWLADHLRAAMGDAPIDVGVQPRAHRRKKLLIADMDSTMIAQECIDELADLVGLKAHVSAVTERAMRGEIAFEPALRERVALLKGLPVSVVDEVIATRITLMPGARALIGTMRAQGAHTVLVSGGFSLFTRTIAAMIGFDENHANTLLVEDGRLTGFVEEPVLGREAKLDTLLDVARFMRLPLELTLAVGDGANDLAMIERAGLGVAYRAKPAVAEAADVRIDHGDLTALLYLQGYRRGEFVGEH